MLGIKRWSNELFDSYFVEESMWGFRVLIGKIKGLIRGCEEEEKREVFIVFGGLYKQ